MTTIRQHVANVAYRFASAYGNPFTLHTPESPSAEFDVRGARIAEWYMNEQSLPHHYLIQSGYVTFRDVVNAQFDALSERIYFMWTDHDPIADAAAIHDCVDSGWLPVWDSKHTGGHPVWDNETNNRFRAVHDVLGHYLNRVGFDKYGEDAAYRAHAATMPGGLIRQLLATETRGQNSALNYGNPVGEFKEQKALFAPEWML